MVPSNGGVPYVVMESWRIAAELARRHPDVVVHESHPGGGQYDVLNIAMTAGSRSGAPGEGDQVLLNRSGSLHLQRNGQMTPFAPWPQVLADGRPDEIITRIEAALGWEPRSSPITARALAYRFLACSLRMLAGGRRRWDVRNEFIDSSGDDPTRLRAIEAFPHVLADRGATEPLGIHGEHSHFWALLRDDRAVAVVSIDGRLYRKSGSAIDLLAAYTKSGARIRRMTATLLSPWM